LHFVESKQIMQHVLKCCKFSCCQKT